MTTKPYFYGVGVGVGDSDDVTVRAIKTINSVDVLFCPTKSETADSFAYRIMEPHISHPSLEIVNLVYPMHYDKQKIKEKWLENAAIITASLQAGKNCAFITLGDPTVYSTFIYTLRYLERELFTLQIVAGITSFCSVSARLAQPLTAWTETLKIIPVRKSDGAQLKRQIEREDNVILMKPSNNPQAIIEAIEALGLEHKFALISKVGTSQERIITSLTELKNCKLPYLSTMLIKKGGFDG